MRISTAYFHDRALVGVTQNQSAASDIQARIASGRRVATAGDDPVGAARAVRARSGLAETGRWQDSQDAARATISLAESTLGSAFDVLASARDGVIASGNASYTATDRRTLAAQLRQGLDQLVGLANAQDGDGAYLFAGFEDREAPFVQNGTAVSFAGDQGFRSADVGPGVRLAVTQSGDDVFMRIASGNGAFAIAAPATNTGAGVANMGRIANATALTGHAYEVRFTAPGTYDVWDANAGMNIATAQPFTAGGTVAFDGIAFEISGAPAAGDVFTVSPAASESVFDRLERAIAMLEDPATGAAANARRSNEIAGILQGLDRAMDRLLEARGVSGNALARLDTLASLAEDRSVAQQTEIGTIEDLDYAQAASELAKRSLAYEAAMAAYSQTGRRSLFDYL